MEMEIAQLSEVITVHDSLDCHHDDRDKAESAFVEMMVEVQKALSAKVVNAEKKINRMKAAAAQDWDDWSSHSAMGKEASPKRRRTVSVKASDGILTCEVDPADAGAASTIISW